MGKPQRKCKCQATLLDDGACRYGCHRIPTLSQLRSAEKRARQRQHEARVESERLGTFEPETQEALRRVSMEMPTIGPMNRRYRQMRKVAAR